MQQKEIKERLVLKPYIKKKIKECLWVIIFFLIGMILVKEHPTMKNTLKENIYEKSIPMTEARKIYQKYISTKEEKKEESVFEEKLQVKKQEQTETGVKLTVLKKETIPNLESGIIVLIEPKKIMIEQVDGVSAIYENIESKEYKLYDYIEKGEILGEAVEDQIQVSFEKKGKYYDYKNYL